MIRGPKGAAGAYDSVLMTSVARPRGLHALVVFAFAALGIGACGAEVVPSDCWIALRAEYRLIPPAGEQVSPEDLSIAVQVIEARIARQPVGVFDVRTPAADRIIVELAEAAEREQVRALIGPTGILQFVPIPPGGPAVESGQRIPPGLPALFGGEELQAVRPSSAIQDLPALEFDLKPRGAQLMAEYTGRNVGNRFAIVLDGEIVSVPTVTAPIADGRGLITGDFNEAEANRLATVLSVGPLPLHLEEMSFEHVQPPAGCP
jgi:preprotein translocase subunit SecD